jgi:hypothetical protein
MKLSFGIEVATAFGVRAFETALVVIPDPTDFREKRPGGFSTITVEKSNLTTKAVPNARTLEAPPLRFTPTIRQLNLIGLKAGLRTDFLRIA